MVEQRAFTYHGMMSLVAAVRYAFIDKAYSEGVSNTDIAAALGISRGTVAGIASKLNIGGKRKSGFDRKGRRITLSRLQSKEQRQLTGIKSAQARYQSLEPAPITLAGPEWSWVHTLPGSNLRLPRDPKRALADMEATLRDEIKIRKERGWG